MFKSEVVFIGSKLRNVFVGAVMYSETLNPYTKVGMGLLGFIQPINIPTPVDFVFYISLISSGSKGAVQNIKSYFNGEARANKNKIVFEAINNLNNKTPLNHIVIL